MQCNRENWGTVFPFSLSQYFGGYIENQVDLTNHES